jgi:antagonist of KipI
MRSYMAVYNELNADKWLNSYSTNIKAGTGGFHGRRLEKEDIISFRNNLSLTPPEVLMLMPWKVQQSYNERLVQFIKGPEWEWLDEASKIKFENSEFRITSNSDRMGYRLNGEGLKQSSEEQLVSSPVSFGTIQLLPDGQLILLMADHQTIGGYPRIAQVISADLPILAQMRPNENVRFGIISLENAEMELQAQQKHLNLIQNECKLKFQNWLDEN